MHPEFAKHVASLQPKFEALIGMQPQMVPTLSQTIPSRGIYLFSDDVIHLYVGRTNTLRSRLQSHCRPSSPQNKAAFAFRLARQATGKLGASYQTSGSREQLIQDPEFFRAFADAKERIRQMSVRFVEETDPVRQCLLEVYVSIVLQTPYNDFDNH